MVQEINVKDLNEAPYNPRIELQPGMPEYEKLKHSIETFGNVEPIVWNKRTGNVVGGHQRLRVLKDMGNETVPCSVVDLDENEEKLLNVALNKIKGQWDYDKLEDILREFDYEVATASGFSAEEIAVILANNSDLLDEDEDYEEWDDFDEPDIVGGSYVITLVFANGELAADWATNEGFNDQIREGSNTTVIRIEE
ncbi:MAG: ParB N-terminal domain-containing protein [Ruminococcus sp.]|nr:ParB N-terminal domain-containing protein [Ruminococcus sp.]